MQPDGLKIGQQRKGVFARSRHDGEEEIEGQQGNPAGHPAAEEFADHEFPAPDRLGQERINRPALPFRRDLARGRGDGDDQRREPNQEQTGILEIPHNVIVVKKADRPSMRVMTTISANRT